MVNAAERRLIDYAREHAGRLEHGMEWVQGGYMGPSWTLVDKAEKPELVGKVSAALEFLRTYTGADSSYFAQAMSSLGPSRSTYEQKCRDVAAHLRAWADQVESGLIQVRRASCASAVQVVCTDLMEQVRILHDDPHASPAAPILLSGASLEIALRRIAEAQELTLDEGRSIAAWGRLLRRNSVISAQEAKDIEQVAGLHNAAANGRFDELSRERAGLMEQQVNFLLCQIDERLNAALGTDALS